MRIFEVTYNTRKGEVYGPLQFQVNEPEDEGWTTKWWEEFPGYTAEHYAFVLMANMVYWNIPDLSLAFDQHFRNKENYIIEEVL
jgi:hypothetical protein